MSFRVRCMVVKKLSELCTDPEEIDWDVIKTAVSVNDVRDELETMSYKDEDEEIVTNIRDLFYDYMSHFNKHLRAEIELSKICEPNSSWPHTLITTSGVGSII